MFKKIILIQLSCLAFFACKKNDKSEAKTEEKKDSIAVVEKKTEEAWSVFALKKGKYESELKLRKKGDQAVEFDLSVLNEQNGCTGSMTGLAEAKAGDSETDEDPVSHEAYPVTEYVHTKDGQFLSIRIDDNWTKVNIKEADKTKELHGETCPFGDVGVLTKK